MSAPTAAHPPTAGADVTAPGRAGPPPAAPAPAGVPAAPRAERPARPPIEVTDPTTGQVIGTVPRGDADDVAAAVAAALAATATWGRTPAAERGAALHRIADAVEAHADELARLNTREGGKLRRDALGGVAAGVGALRQYAELGPVHRGRSLHGALDAIDLMVPVPRGVAAVITPWNDPVAIACGLLGANLAVGNATVFKPSERTPLHAALLAELFAAELPPGALVLLQGDRTTGALLVDHPAVDLVCHVGSVAAGADIGARCAARLAKAVLELGGKDALVVDAGVDPAWAAEQAALGAFANAGQICTSVERVYVHRDVAAPFLDALVARAEALVVGDPDDDATELGPLVDEAQLALVAAHVDEARHLGAQVRCGGHRLERPGAFYAPTVLTDVTEGMRVLRDETFGPVAPVMVVDDVDDALRRADGSRYGLAATVLTPDPAVAQRAWRALAVGTVKINAVFGGAPGGAATPHKHSGNGFGYGPELLDEVSATRVVHWRPLGPDGRPVGDRPHPGDPATEDAGHG